MSGTESQRYESAHDPMCPIAHSPTTVNRIRELVEETPEGRTSLERSAEQWCECPLIAKVRADEREKAAQRVVGICAHTKYEGCHPCPHDEAVAAVLLDNANQDGERRAAE